MTSGRKTKQTFTGGGSSPFDVDFSSNKITAQAAITPAAGFEGDGDGSQAKPFLIATAEQLAFLAKQVNTVNNYSNGKFFKLTADIVLNDVSNLANWGSVAPKNTWTPIGNESKEFKGEFDGCGHTVSGIYMKVSAGAYFQGLFGQIIATATVKNVGVINSYIKGAIQVGGVVGQNYGKVINCYNTGTVIGTTNVGGVVGYNNGSILNCYNTGAVTGTNHVGGVVGNNLSSAVSNGSILNCYNTGAVTGTADVGGVVGYNTNGAVANCYFLTNKITIGGTLGEGNAVGTSAGTGTATNCSPFGVNKQLTTPGDTPLTTDNKALVTFGANVDLLATLNLGATAYNGANPTATPATEWVAGAGIYPTFKPIEIMPITPADKFAGGDGTQNDPYQISTAPELAYMAQEVNKDSQYSRQKFFKLKNDIVVNDGTIDKESNASKPWVTIGMVSSPFAGTFDGDGYTVSGIYINSSETEVPQGLFGETSNESVIKNVGVINSYIMGHKGVGGIVGNNRGTVTNCYNQGDVGVKGDVVENSNFGGIAGYNEGAVANCYSSGKVTGKGIVGGVVGNNGGSVNHCYFLTGTIYIDGTLQTPENEKAVGYGNEFNCAKFSTTGALDVLIDSTHYYDLLEALNLVANTNKTWYGVTGGYPSFNLNLYVDANKVVYANGLPITIKAGSETGKTNIYFDSDINNPIKLSEAAPTAAGYDLSTYTVYGGGITPSANPSVTMLSGKVKSIYGGGSGVNGTVTGTKTVKVSGESIIGADETSGIIIDGGTPAVTNGVDSFIINGALGAGAKINVVLPSGYGLGTVATKASAVTTDEVAKFTLVGATLKKLEGSGTNLVVVTDLPKVTFKKDKQSLVYDKTAKSFTVTSTTDGVTDGFKVQYRKNGSTDAFIDTAPMNAGLYDVKVTRGGTTTHAPLDEEIKPGLEITKRGVGLRWTEPTSLVYDKTAKTPSVVVMQSDLYGDDKCTVTAGLTGEGNNTNVGTFTFTATALSNPNYIIKDDNAVSDPYIITARPLKNIKVSKVADTNVDFNITLTVDHCVDLVSGDNVIITFKTSKADKGTYTGSVAGQITDFSVSGTSAGNYSVDVADLTATITGKPIPAFTAMASKEYTKLAQSPLPVSFVSEIASTNYTLSWSYAVPGGTKFTAVTGEPEFINAGTYKVTATGLGDYEGSTQTAEYEITQKEVVIAWQSPMEYTYTGSPIVPNVEVTGFISGDSCEVSVKEPTVGSNINVGTFKMTAKALSNPNYKLPTPADSGEYTIKKVETNAWTTPLSIANIYVGGTLAPNAVPTIGEVVYTYYTDNKDAKGDALEVAPAEVGTYWVTAKVARTDNYVEIAESEAVKFTISQKPSVSEGGSITPKDILWTGIVNDLKFKDDPIVEKSVDSDIIPKKVLLELQKVDKTLKLSANGETLVITSKQVKPLTFDKAMYSFAELKAMLEVKPEVTPTPTPTPTEKPTEPTEPTAKKCWLCGACPMFLGVCLWIWLAVAIVAVAAVVVFIVLKKKKKNDKK